jgi:MSHA biogenesis protein MshP
MNQHLRSSMKKTVRGFGSVLAIIILVVMAVLGAALLRFGSTQQTTLGQDIVSSRAWAAARSGNEWGLFKALSSTTPADTWKTCSGLSSTLDLSASTGFWVTVTCNSSLYNEGESLPGTPATVRVYLIQATACNSSAGCPDASKATSADYVERVRQVTATN